MKSTLALAAFFYLFTDHPVLAQTAPDGSSLPDFRARVRFHYREKNVSAPASTDEDLPAAQFLPEKQRRIIEGKVPNLGFKFYLRLSRPDPERAPLLEVNVVDPVTGRSLEGFPVKQELTDAGGSFELPLSELQKRHARLAVGEDGQYFITYVNLIVNLATDR
jgi:hypothetical protein